MSRRIQTIHDGHLEIQDDDIRVQLLSLMDGDLAIFGLATYTPLRVLFDTQAEHASDESTVISNERRTTQPPFALRLLAGLF